MRRDRDADNGVVEFMVAGIVGAARRLRRRRLSLNFAMFRGVFSGGEQIGAGPVLRLAARGADVRIALVAAGVAVPLEREVPAPVGAAVHLLPDQRRGVNRGVIAAGVAEGFLPGPHRRPPTRRPSDEFADGRARPSTPRRRRGSGRVDAYAALPSAAGAHGASSSGCAAAGIDAYPVGVARARHRAPPSASITGLVPTPDRRGRRRSSGASCPAATTAALRFAVIIEDGAGSSR